MMQKGIIVCQWGSRIINGYEEWSSRKAMWKVTCNEFTKPNSFFPAG